MPRSWYERTHMTVPGCIAGIISISMELPIFDQKIAEAEANGLPAPVIAGMKRQRGAKERWLKMKSKWLEMQTIH